MISIDSLLLSGLLIYLSSKGVTVFSNFALFVFCLLVFYSQKYTFFCFLVKCQSFDLIYFFRDACLTYSLIFLNKQIDNEFWSKFVDCCLCCLLRSLMAIVIGSLMSFCFVQVVIRAKAII